MSSANPSKDAKPGFFTIYKPGQGKYLRWGTVAALAIVVLTGTGWIYWHVIPTAELPVRTGAIVVWTLLCAFGIFMLVNTPRMAEFLIMTEIEMRKVAWPSRKDVISSTKIVILMTILLSLLLLVVDVGFAKLFQALKIL